MMTKSFTKKSDATSIPVCISSKSKSKSKSRTKSRSTSPKLLPVKRIAVEKAHNSISQLLEHYYIPQVKKVFGTGIIRVCCRTVPQLDNIPLILHELIKFHLIEEIGMPLEYSYKMKSLVLFLKPRSEPASSKLDRVFQRCTFAYHHLVVEVLHPNTATKVTFKDEIETIGSNNSAKQVQQMQKGNVTVDAWYMSIVFILLFIFLFGKSQE
jgi:hypothetical protein